MQVAGPYDLLGGIRRALPKVLPILEGATVPVEWYMRDELPVTQPNEKGKPLPYPHGVYHILPPIVPRNAVAADADEPYRMVPTPQTDIITYVAGTRPYLVTEEDIASVTSVTGTLNGTPGHVFVEGADYTFTVDSIVWTEVGDVPDDGTQFTVVYNHRLYYPRVAMDSRVTVRATIKAKAYQVLDEDDEVVRHYSMSTLAAVMGNALELKLRSMAANRIVRPATVDEPYVETMTIGRVLAAGPLPVDASGTVASWYVDFTINIAAIFEFDAVRSILDVPIEVELTS